MKGTPTRERYRCATIFVDRVTDFTVVFLQRSTSIQETLEAKRTWEDFANQNGTEVRGYQTDNGIFSTQAWKEKCIRAGQNFTYCGVSSHHQNGKAERKIRELQDMARTMIVHATIHWPDAITPHLWPYAIHMAAEALNNTLGKTVNSIRHHTKHTVTRTLNRGCVTNTHSGAPPTSSRGSYKARKPYLTNGGQDPEWEFT